MNPSTPPDLPTAASSDSQTMPRPGGLANDRVATGLTATGGVAGAILASSCCIIPLALVGFGIGGAWMMQLTALAPYQPLFIALALVFLAAGFWMVYWRPKAACADGSACATPRSHRIVKMALWGATALIALTLTLPVWAPLLLDS